MTNRRSCCSAAGDVQCAMACVTTPQAYTHSPVTMQQLADYLGELMDPSVIDQAVLDGKFNVTIAARSDTRCATKYG